MTSPSRSFESLQEELDKKLDRMEEIKNELEELEAMEGVDEDKEAKLFEESDRLDKETEDLLKQLQEITEEESSLEDISDEELEKLIDGEIQQILDKILAEEDIERLADNIPAGTFEKKTNYWNVQVDLNSERILRLPEVKAITKLGKSKIYALMKVGKFPQNFSLFGTRARGWLYSDVISWIKSLKPSHQDTSAISNPV